MQESRTWQDSRATQDTHHDGAKALIQVCPSLPSEEIPCPRFWGDEKEDVEDMGSGNSF